MLSPTTERVLTAVAGGASSTVEAAKGAGVSVLAASASLIVLLQAGRVERSASGWRVPEIEMEGVA